METETNLQNPARHTPQAPTKPSPSEAAPEWSYAPSIESSDWVKIDEHSKLFINGQFISDSKQSTFPTLNPATLETLSQIPTATSKQIDEAVQAAHHAYETTWSKLSGATRGRYLFRIARLIQERSRELAILECLDNGKPIREARDIDIPLAAAHFFYYAGWADKLDYAFPGQKVAPIGVAGQIIPWNFPLLMAAWKIAPALATGNTVVLKPAETTSLTALRLAEIIQEAGVPDGVVNIITGAGEVGAELIQHPLVKKIAFTGSTEIGRKIIRETAGSSKKLTLELGGKSAHLVFSDAPIDQAVEGVVRGIFFNQGHVCCAGSRLLVQEEISELFLEKLKQRMEKLRVGNPLDKNTDIGAINSKEQFDKIQSLIQSGKEEGADFFETKASPIPNEGYFIRPCFFNSVSSSASIYRMEIFGPVLAVSTFRTPKEAVIKANDTPYGLAAGVWTDKGSKIQKIAGALKAGVVWANTYHQFDPASPFGGYFESGWGREGGLHGLRPYVTLASSQGKQS